MEGTPLIFEVRGHNVHVLLNDNERFAKLHFYRMSKHVVCEKPKINKNDKDKLFNNQTLQLSPFFNM